MSIFPLTGIQNQFRTASKIHPESPAYNIAVFVRIDGELSAERLRQAWRQVFESTEIFKTSFPEIDEKPMACINDNVSLPWQELSCNDNQILELASPLFYDSFNLDSAPLVRTALYKTAPDRHYFILVQHHIITDLHSKKIIADTISKIYNKTQAELPATGYSKFFDLERAFLSGSKGQKALVFWKEKVKQGPGTLEIPFEKEHPSVFQGKGDSIAWNIPDPLADQIKRKEASNLGQLFLWLLTAYISFLSRISGQKNFAVGVPLSNRRLEGMSNVIGPFVNILPVCVDISDKDTFQSLYDKVRKEMLLNHRYQEVPFVEIAGFLRGKRDASRPHLIQAGFTMEPEFDLKLEGLKCTNIPIEKRGAQLDLFFTFWPTKKSFSGYWEFNSDLISRQIATEWQASFNTLLQESVERVDDLLASYRIATPKFITRHNDWNRTERGYPLEGNLALYLRTAFTNHRDEIALILEDREVSYREMEMMVCNTAIRLHRDFGCKNRIALLLNPSPEMVLAIHSVIQSGNAYVPIDPEWPHERIRLILEDIRPAAVIAESGLNSFLSEMDYPVIDSEHLSSVGGDDVSYPDLSIGPEDSAYIIYTSGSTGAPKGAELPHKGVLNRIFWMQDEYKLTTQDRVLQKTPYTFDVSVWEFLWPFFAGAGLVVIKPGGNRDPYYLKETIDKKKVSVLHFVPSMLSIFLSVPGVSELSSIRDVICSGEALTKGQEKKFFEIFKSARLHNLYGPTEASIDVTFWECGKEDEKSYPAVPIGKPIANIKLYIMDRYGHLCPPLVEGELLIGGVGLAKGYWNRPGLTAEKFISNPFGQGKVYRTGDICRYRLDGTIEYIGRSDFQVKLYGLRVELGEIENAMETHPDIDRSAAIVWTRAENDSRLVVYFTCNRQDIIPSEDNLRNHLRDILPGYMAPAHYIYLESMPLNPNGKLNRKKLPLPALDPFLEIKHLPEDEIQRKIHSLWKDVLSGGKYGTKDNFFDVGGTSLTIMQLSLNLEKEFGSRFDVLDLFRFPTISEMAILVAGKTKQKKASSNVRAEKIKIRLQKSARKRNLRKR